MKSIAGFNTIKKLGSGKTGTAYLLADGNVLKVSGDSDEFEMACKLIENPQQWSVKIFSATKIGKKFYIVKERVEMINAGEKEADRWYGYNGRGNAWANEELKALFLQSIEGQGNVTFIAGDFCRGYENAGYGRQINRVKLTDEQIEMIAEGYYYEQRDKDIFRWFARNVWAAYEFGCDVRDLYANMGIDKEGRIVFFDVM